jgi:glycosyltransferase involved in cell wall biosynthesis
MSTVLSIVIPCYNEENTLETCVDRVRSISDDTLRLEIIIVDDCSRDRSLEIARELAQKYPEIKVQRHEVNQGKGAALRTGFQHATGDIVAVQDADLEYDPNDLKRLIQPIEQQKADVVLGSRFLSSGVHRVFYFWHSMGNKFLTLLSNMYTDLNLTDMETCYKVFRREVIQDVKIHENRFGFEPEIVAEIAHRRLRIYEMGISYDGRSYAEGKKIGVQDGFRAIYCILRYNAYRSPVPLQLLLYLGIGGVAALVHLVLFTLLFQSGAGLTVAILLAGIPALVCDYFLVITLLFRRGARWPFAKETGLLSCLAYSSCSLTGTAPAVCLCQACHPILLKSWAHSLPFLLVL